MHHTTTSGRAHAGKLADGWVPGCEEEASLLQQLSTRDLGRAPLVLRLAAQACQALRVRWEASRDHVTALSPWEVSASPTQTNRQAGAELLALLE